MPLRRLRGEYRPNTLCANRPAQPNWQAAATPWRSSMARPPMAAWSAFFAQLQADGKARLACFERYAADYAMDPASGAFSAGVHTAVIEL
jgi:hypothetical protein